jgi:hypothetical protein
MEFNYTIEQTKDCINHTEQQLRDLISTVLSRSYGPSWEYSSSVWNDEIRGQLEERRRADQGNRPYQVVSQRLLDYSDIVDLRNIIERHWNLFGGVFQSKQRIMHRFDDLQTLRNPEMHGRPDILPYQKHLCLGVCGEIMAAIDYWSYGYEHAIKEYTLGIRIPVYVKNGDEIVAQEEVVALAQQWLENVGSKLGVIPRELPTEDGTKVWQIAFQHMHVRVTLTEIYPGDDGRVFRAADITIKTVNATALSRVIEAGEHPYWFLGWILSDDLGPSTVAAQVFTRTGKRPVSSTEIRAGDVNLLTHAEFRVGEADGESIRIMLSRWKLDEDAKVCLIYDGPTNKGFYSAHEVFSVKNVLSILYGEIPYWKVRELMEEACSLKSQV